jgi:hypothetical protein
MARDYFQRGLSDCVALSTRTFMKRRTDSWKLGEFFFEISFLTLFFFSAFVALLFLWQQYQYAIVATVYLFLHPFRLPEWS